MPVGAVSTITYEDFGEGIDRREGLTVRDARKFYSQENVYTTPGRKIRRRPPVRNFPGQLAANSQSLRLLNGLNIAIAKAGDTVTHTVVGMSITTLYFDPPEGSDAWELVEILVFNEKVVALIRHNHPASQAAPWRNALHVWDDKRPTYVVDPSVPTSWAKTLPLHPYGPGELGAYRDYKPRLVIAGDRLAMTTAAGDTALSAIDDPRVWNTRAPSDILANGEMWYAILDNATNPQLTFPVPYFDLVVAGKYAAYVCEYCDGDGEWHQYRERTILTNLGDYRLEPVVNRFDPAKPAETRVTLTLGADGTVVRFRALAQPAATVQSGLYLVPDGTVVGGILSHEGADFQINSYPSATGMSAGQDYHVSVEVPGAPITVPTIAQGGLTTMPLNGQERYWSRIIAVAEAASATAFAYAITGTVTVAANSTRVAGAATTFLDDLQVGRRVEVNGERRVVKFIASDLLLEVDAPFTAAAAGATALSDISFRYAANIGDTGNTWYAEREADATFVLSGKDDALTLPTSLYDDSGGQPVALAAMQNRLLIQYPSALQSWATGTSATADFRLLSIMGQGAGVNTRPEPVLLDGYAGLPSVAGPRLFAPEGNNKDYIEFVPVGDKLKGIAIPDLRRAVWWPRLRVWLTCATDGGGNIFCLSVHKADKEVLAWSTWSLTGITTIDTMFVQGEVLVVVSGRNVHRIDPDATRFRDDNDALGGPAYSSKARWLYNTMGSPQRNKRLVRVEIAQVGKCKLSIYMNPKALTEEAIGPTASGYTMGLQRVPVAVMGPAIGLAVESVDETGYELESVGFDYLLLNR